MTQTLPICVCGALTTYVDAIGPVCPNKACPIVDGPFDGSPAPTVVSRSGQALIDAIKQSPAAQTPRRSRKVFRHQVAAMSYFRMQGRRRYKSGMNWAFWRWSAAPGGILERLHVVKTPWFAVCMHWINAPDPEQHLHDHPAAFISFVLRGGYLETHVKNGKQRTYYRERRTFNAFAASPDDRHKIVGVVPGTVTLALMGPKVREWGFTVDGVWVEWREYYRALGKGCS